MANYVVSDSSLGSVADAIRQKGGTSAPLEYPAEFISAIEAISTADEIIVTDVKDGQGVVTRTINTGDNPVTRIVRGAPPLTLDDAKAGNMVSLTQQGLCTQSGTPTPDAPVDIVCNNGALKYGALGSNLYDPSTSVFEIGYYYNPNNGAQTAAPNNYIYQAYIPIEAGEAYVFYGRRKSGNNLSQYNRIHWYTADKTFISTNSYTGGTMGKGVAPSNAVYARLSCNPLGLTTTITEETVLGYNWTFCKGTAEVAPFVPFVGGVKPVGTPEVLTVSGQNLVDLTAVTDGYYYDQSGVYAALAVARVTDFIPVASGQKYTVYVKAQQGGTAANVRCNLFDFAKTWKSQSSFTVTSGSEAVDTITPTENGYLRVSANYTGTGAKADWSTLQIVVGEYTLATMPPYQPYVAIAPQNVTDIPMLLSVGDYKDEGEIISGLLTHKVGVMVFDGTEAWRASSSANIYILDSAIAVNLTAICTHFQKVSNTTSAANMPDGSFKGHASNAILYFKDVSAGNVDGFKAWLSAQYAAGTPVILLYTLATETTEQLTPQPLTVADGSQQLSVQAEVSGIQIEAVFPGTFPG